jgi:antagonist of KipI
MSAQGRRRIVIVDAGMLSTIQDLGRSGYGAVGVSPSGAVDWFAARAANRLVGNPDGAALLECTMTGMTFDACDQARIAVTGADAPLRIADAARSLWRAHTTKPGDRVVVGAAKRGLRSYVAFDGGIDVDCVMGSRSTDLGAGIGGRRVETGDSIALFDSDLRTCEDPPLAYAVRATPDFPTPVELRAMDGPDADRFGRDGLDALLARTYRASTRSTRQALRFEGEAVPIPGGADIISAGTCAGCVQVTGDGLPILLLAEHQTTGGYAVPLCVISADLPKAAQVRPGDTVQLRRVAYAAAIAALADAAARLRELGPAPAPVERGTDVHLARGFFEGA